MIFVVLCDPSRQPWDRPRTNAMRLSPRPWRRGFSTLRLEPLNTATARTAEPRAARSAVILLHGLGDTAEGWLSGAHFLQQGLPETRFLRLGWWLICRENLKGNEMKWGEIDTEICQMLFLAKCSLFDPLVRRNQSFSEQVSDFLIFLFV